MPCPAAKIDTAAAASYSVPYVLRSPLAVYQKVNEAG